jgi:hypothetical protein
MAMAPDTAGWHFSSSAPTTPTIIFALCLAFPLCATASRRLQLLPAAVLDRSE